MSQEIKFLPVAHDQLYMKKTPKIADAAIDCKYINHVKIEILVLIPLKIRFLTLMAFNKFSRSLVLILKFVLSSF